MKRARFLLALTVLFSLPVLAETAPTPTAKKPEPPSGMERYVFGLIKKGPAWTPGSTPETQEIQKGHMANIEKLAKEGKLILAGPFEGGEDFRGIFVFKVPTLDEAKALCETDPAVKAGRLKVDLIYWWGPSVLTDVVKAWEESRKK